MPRPSWSIGTITKGDMREADRAIQFATPTTGSSFIPRFEMFVFCNEKHLEDPPILMRGLMGQLRRCGLKWSSINTYMRYALDYLLENHHVTSSEKMRITRMMKVVRIMAADEDVVQARRASLTTLKKVLRATPSSHKPAVAMLLMTGGRWKDLTKLRFNQMRALKGCLRVQYRWCKNRTKPQDRFPLRVPHELGVVTPKCLRRLLSRQRSVPLSRQRPWLHVSTKKMNDVLRKACAAAGVEKLTTYSFRHNYIARAIGYARANNLEVHHLTGHMSGRLIDACYSEELMDAE